ncbi:protein SpAN [Strongylocentrotus purpuratus]|uniref:Metalloendopeptidase n=1 Tax=Strongylocentrotus purpuratus TaxID=7668 RepID=A0A7M7RAZ3_STRPU|nr:protein SpAN [Strongylocentrotus purpuratus]
MKFAVALCLLLCAIGVMTLSLPGAVEEEQKSRAEREKEKELPDNFGAEKRSDEAEFKRGDDEMEFKRASEEECEATITKWTDDTVYYAYCSAAMKNKYSLEAFAQVSSILDGILTFKDVTKDDYDCTNNADREHYIAVVDNGKSEGCWSYVGMLSGEKQTLNLQTGKCTSVYVIIHEIFHALGLLHTQQRPDSPQYITVNTQNIKDGKEGNFAMKESMCTTCKYQTCSLMHYGRTFFSKGGETITPLDPDMGPDQGKQNQVQAGDLCAIYLLYDAREKETCKEVDGDGNDYCLWGTGNAYNFKCCRCPDHFTGDNCGTFDENAVSDNSGEKHEVTQGGAPVTVTSPNNAAGSSYLPSTKKTYFISAPTNCNVQMSADFISVENDASCYWDQLRYWSGESILDCPETICGEYTDVTYTSKSNFFMLEFNSDDMYNEKGFIMSFEAVNCT